MLLRNFLDKKLGMQGVTSVYARSCGLSKLVKGYRSSYVSKSSHAKNFLLSAERRKMNLLYDAMCFDCVVI